MDVVAYGFQSLANLDAEEAARMVRLWYIFDEATTLSIASVPPYLGAQLLVANGTELCAWFRPQRLKRVDLADASDRELRTITCPPLPEVAPICSLRWLLIALLVLALLIFLASCCCCAWVFLDGRQERERPQRAHAAPEHIEQYVERRVVSVPEPKPRPSPQPATTWASIPPRRPTRPGKIDPIAEHLENADEDMQDLQAIKFGISSPREPDDYYELPYAAGEREAPRWVATAPSKQGRTDRDGAALRALLLAFAFLCIFMLALIAVIFSASGVAMVFDPETVCVTPW